MDEKRRNHMLGDSVRTTGIGRTTTGRVVRAAIKVGLAGSTAVLLPLATGTLSSAHAATAHAATAAPPWAPPPITATAPSQGPASSDSFGADVVNFDYTGWGPAAEGHLPSVALGVDRIWDDESTWAAIEPANGQWNFSLLDQQVSGALSHGSKVMYVMGETPTWASSLPTVTNIYGAGAAAAPTNIADWRTYVSAIATRYKGKISSYEVWDEADASTFHGTPQQMVNLATVAYETIKQIDPSASVLTPSFTQDALTSGWLSAYLAAGGGTVADAFAGHIYPNSPEQGGSYALQYRKALAAANVSLPVWITETGYRGYSSTGQALYTAAQGQALVSRTLMDEFEGGASEVLWYGANSNKTWLSLGDGAYPANASAYSDMTNWLAGKTPIGCGAYTTGIYAGLSGCYFKQANGSTAVMLYDAIGTFTMAGPSTSSLMVSSLTGSQLLPRLTPVTIGGSPVLITIA